MDVEKIQNEHLQEIHQALLRTQSEAKVLFAQLDNTQINWSPSPKKWSIGMCFGHLVATMDLYYPLLNTTIEKVRAENKTQSTPFKPSWFGKTFVGFISPESKFKLIAPKKFKPNNTIVDATIFAKFDAHLTKLARLISAADGYDINKTKFPTPVSRLIRFSIGEGLWLQIEHNRRHLMQAQRLVNHPDFPKNDKAN